MYAAELWDGLISVWNVADKKLPIRITDAPTAEQFTHAAWIEKIEKFSIQQMNEPKHLSKCGT